MITVTTMMTFFHELDIIEAANVVVEVGISLRKLQHKSKWILIYTKCQLR